ncbi:hypothetical protein VTK26DRAFT_1888 [Humicola hyalothermophila]
MTGIALLGAGIFAREEHLPAILAVPSLTLKAIYSRSRQSAEALAASLPDPSSVDLYYDVPAEPGRSLADLLRRGRDDVAAVDVALPITRQPGVVRAALAAGKHVLSEKPVAGDVEGARALLEWYAQRHPAGEAGEEAARPLWAVAENWRFMESLLYAAERVREVGGRVVTFRLERYGFMSADNKYFNTEWRKVPQYQGGFLLDGGVHFVAGLRHLLAAAGQEIKQLTGFTTLLDERLIPADTIHAVALTQDGKAGNITITFGTEFKSSMDIEIVTTNGRVVWTPTEVKTVVRQADGTEKTETKQFAYSSGVKAEVEEFARAVERGELDGRQTPEEALKDLEILQRLLESGAAGAAVKAIGV